MKQFIKHNEWISFLEFIFKNAMKAHKRNIKKVEDFFSWIMNTISNLINIVYEVKVLLRIMCNETNQRENI